PRAGHRGPDRRGDDRHRPGHRPGRRARRPDHRRRGGHAVTAGIRGARRADAPERPPALRAAWERIVAAPGAAPVLAIAGTLVLTTVVLLAAGVSPAEAYPAIVRGAVGEGNLEYTVANLVPTLGMALAFAIPFRAGALNLGGDAQLGLAVAAPLAAAALAGALLAGVAAPLRTRLGIPAIVSTLLLSTPAVAFASYLVRFPLGEQGTGIAQTPPLPEAAHLPALGGSGHVTLAVPLVLALTAAWAYADARTVLGYEVRATGANREFARYGGVAVDRLATATLALGGA